MPARILSLSLLLVSSALHAQAQRPACPGIPSIDNAGLTGVVLFADSKPLTYSQVSLPDLKCQTRVDMSGRFTISGIPAGEHRLVVVTLGPWQMDTTVTARAGAFTQLVLRPSKLPDPLTRACPEWPSCDRLPTDTILDDAALQTLLLLSEPDMSSAAPAAVPRCLMLSDTIAHDKPFPASLAPLSDGTPIYPMRHCTRGNSGEQYRAPDGSPAAALFVELKSTAASTATYFLTVWHPPFWVSTWACNFERRGSAGWRVVSCAQPLQG